MSQEMKLKIEFSDWATFSPELKSLLSIYMENASLYGMSYFSLDQSQSQSSEFSWSFDKSSCSIAHNQFEYNNLVTGMYNGSPMVMSNSSFFSDHLELYIPYKSKDSSYSKFDSTKGSEYVCFNLPIVDTKLISTVSEPRIVLYQSRNERYYTNEIVSDSVMGNSINTDCAISPLINDEVNTNDQLCASDIYKSKLSMIDAQDDNIQKSTVGLIRKPVELAKVDSVETKYKFELQTAPFYMNSVDNQVCYKLGIYILPKSINLVTGDYVTLTEDIHSTVKSALKSQPFEIVHQASDDGGIVRYITSRINQDLFLGLSELTYQINTTELSYYQELSPSRYEEFPLAINKTLVLPIVMFSESIMYMVGYVYMKLYNIDGTPVTGDTNNVPNIGYMDNGNNIAADTSHIVSLPFSDI